MKGLFEAWHAYKELKKMHHLLPIVKGLFEFCELAHKEQKPMYTKVVLLNMADKDKVLGGKEVLGDFVSLWAGVGDANPIERCKGLKAQNVELKRLLVLARNGELKEDDMQHVDMVLKVFE